MLTLQHLKILVHYSLNIVSWNNILICLVLMFSAIALSTYLIPYFHDSFWLSHILLYVTYVLVWA